MAEILDEHRPEDEHRAAAAARLQGERSTAVFRVLLDTIARPGCVRDLPPFAQDGFLPPACAVPLALADLGLTVAVTGADAFEAARVERVLRLATGASGAVVEHADLAVLLEADPVIVDRLRAGTELAPEAAARVAVQVEDLELGVPFLLDGPGVAAPMRTTMGTEHAFLAALRRRNARPPVGIDTWLVDRCGRIVALPRSSRIEVGTMPVGVASLPAGAVA
ncbi:MAG: phosphonate C-P lyase system protein PhnH [Acidimicrobiia bacterium]